jgi:hypothetical protein
MSHFQEKIFVRHLGHLIYCYVLHKYYYGEFRRIYDWVLKCHILCHIVDWKCHIFCFVPHSYHPRQIKPSFDLSLSYARALAGIFEKKWGELPLNPKTMPLRRSLGWDSTLLSSTKCVPNLMMKMVRYQHFEGVFIAKTQAGGGFGRIGICG